MMESPFSKINLISKIFVNKKNSDYSKILTIMINFSNYKSFWDIVSFFWSRER